MAKVIEVLKKNEDLLIDLVSNETATNIAQRKGHIVVIQPGNNTQNQCQGLDGNSQEEEEEGQLLIIQPANTTQNQEEDNIIAQQQGQKLDESTRNSQKQEGVNNDDDFEPLPEGFVPEERANFSRPPGQRPAPEPKTG